MARRRSGIAHRILFEGAIDLFLRQRRIEITRAAIGDQNVGRAGGTEIALVGVGKPFFEPLPKSLRDVRLRSSAAGIATSIGRNNTSNNELVSWLD
jgi:hypothetical protein